MSRDVHCCSHWLRPRTPPRIWAHLGRSWSAKKDDISPCNPLPSTYQYCRIGARERSISFPHYRSQTKLWPFPLQPIHYLLFLSISLSYFFSGVHGHLTGPGRGRLQRITRKHIAATQPLPSRHRLFLAQQGSWGQAASLFIHSLRCGNFFWEHVLPRYDPSSVGSRHRWHAHQKYHFLLHSTGESVFLDICITFGSRLFYYILILVYSVTRRTALSIIIPVG
jgi:hypothetical protein